MPPVMGTTAFVMASFLGMPYSQIIIAAAIPSILYYLGLFVQIDAYAARNGLKGMPRSELPSLKETFKEGWHYIFVFAILIVNDDRLPAGDAGAVLCDCGACRDQPAAQGHAAQSQRLHQPADRGGALRSRSSWRSCSVSA